MPSRSFQFFMTPNEYWQTIWMAVSEKFIVVQEDLATRDGIPLKPGSVPDDWKRGIYKAFPISVEPSDFKTALREPAKFGMIVLRPPATTDSLLISGGIGIKNHWFEGDVCYEKNSSLENYKLFHHPLNKLIVGWTEIVSDADGTKSPRRGLRCSEGSVNWVRGGGVLKWTKKDPDHFVPLWDSLKKPK